MRLVGKLALLVTVAPIIEVVASITSPYLRPLPAYGWGLIRQADKNIPMVKTIGIFWCAW